jgi:hypothetical protein
MRIIFICIVVIWTSGLFSQNKQLIYGVKEIPQSLLVNPGGVVEQKYHFGIPFLSQFHINGGSSGVSVYDIFQESDGDINDRIRNAIFDMDNTDFFTATQQLELINFGWRAKNEIYFSGGVYQEFDFILYFPKDLAVLTWEGNQDYIDYRFDLGEVSTTGDFLTVYHFGANKKLTKKLTLGLRAKLYSSMISYRSVDNQGTFYTRFGDGTMNVYQHILEGIDMKMETSGYASLRDLDGASQVTSSILGRAFFGGNFGIGADIGATYDINDKVSVSASLLDIGTIFHSKDVETYHAHGDYTLDGIELLFPPFEIGEPAPPYWDDLEDEFENEIPIDTINNSYSQMRPLKVNAGISYSFGRILSDGGECDCRNRGGGIDRDQNAGIQFYSMFRPKGPQMAGTLFYYRRFTDYISAKATYTVDPFSYSNIGLGIVADIGKFNLYIAADNLLKYGNLAKAKSVSLQFGFNIKVGEE